MPKNVSTGPRTESGKATSRQNSLKHGLASATILIPGENSADFAILEENLIAQYQPADPTETILVTDMAKHHWLKERALRLQSQALATATPGELPASFPVLLRYQTTNERAFHKALLTLLALRKQQIASQRQQAQFVSQQEKQDEQDELDAMTEFIHRPLTWSSGSPTAEHLALIARNRELYRQKFQPDSADTQVSAAG